MKGLRGFWIRLIGLFSAKRRERAGREFDAELESHIAMHADDNVRAGMTLEQARRAAILRLGGMEAARQARREGVIVVLMENLWRDVQYALRQLWKTPGFTITAVLTLALGIGANAAIFTLVHAVLLKNLPVADPKTLVRIGDINDCCQNSSVREDGDYALFSTDTYEQFRKNTPEFEDLAAVQAGFEHRPIVARRDGKQEIGRSAVGEYVSGNYFRTFGLQPAAGRMLQDSDDVPGAPMIAVMSYDQWKSDYNGDPAVVGSTFWVNTKPVTVIGIAPTGILWRPAVEHAAGFLSGDRGDAGAGGCGLLCMIPNTNWLYIVGRVKPGVALDPLQDKIERACYEQILRQQGVCIENEGASSLAEAHVVLTPAKRASAHAGGVRVASASADVDFGAGAADCVREHCEPSAGARHGSQGGDARCGRRWARCEAGSFGNC